MSLINDIRQQSRSVRMLLFTLSLMTTLSLVGLLWVSSFQRDLYALLNTPTPDPNADRLAGEMRESSKSPFAFIKDAFANTANSLLGLISESSDEDDSQDVLPTKKTRPYVFPISEPR